MTKDVEQNWHRNSSTVASELTVRLGKPFSELCAWAVERELERPLAIGYSILGLTPMIVGIGNLVQELNQPESRTITAEWCVNPIVHELKKFTEAFTADARISRQYTSISHRGGVDKNRLQFKKYSTETFLLTLITNPLADITDETTYINRRRLRIWLIIQAASRLIDYGCAADKSISSAARFMVIGESDENWLLIDDLLKIASKQLWHTPNTYQRFTMALANAARIIQHDPIKRGKIQQQFLNSIVAIAHGECHEFKENLTRNITLTPAHFRLTTLTIDDPVFGGDIGVSNFNILPTLDDEEEAPLSYVTDIDPTDSKAQQILSSGSVYIQTMERSHYLPWSWDRVLPTEAHHLETWVHNKLNSQDTTKRMGAALVWLAMRLSRSLALIERITITSELTEEWSLSQDFRFLKRTAPRRRSAWRPNEVTRHQVAAFLNDLTIEIPANIGDVLKTTIQNSEAIPATLGALWKSISADKLDSWFSEQARLYFPRLSSAKLGNYYDQRLFDATGDFIFSRLLSSHPNSALPGACSYTTWDIKAIEKGLQLPVLASATETDSCNIIGSLLAPLELVLHEEIERCNNNLKLALGKGLIQYHNALAQYVVMALYAASGARTLRDPFESRQHFSIKHHCVFINDKNDGSLHNGRLVPLPAKTIELLNYYQKHLFALSLRIEEHRPDLAQQLSNLIECRSANMPFFFLLDENLRWHSMANAAQLDCALFEWQLPSNLFRHRYSQRLLKEGIEPEVIEGWMGHAERGAASYSDYSARCWESDVKVFRDALERAYASLPFIVPDFQQELPPLLYLPVQKTTYSEPDLFGQRERTWLRSRRIKAAVREARVDIKLFLNGRSLMDVSDDDLMLLSNRMLLRENRLPHPQAALRLRILIKNVQKLDSHAAQASQAGSLKGAASSGQATINKPMPGYARYQLLRKRIIDINDERWFITPRITVALEIYEQLSIWAETVRKSALKASLSRAKALTVGVVLLAVEKRLGYKQLLLDIVHSKHFRLLQNKREYFIEYSEALESDDFSAAVQRHEISYKTASLLAHGTHLKKQVDTPQTQQIEELSEILRLHAQYNPDNLTPSVCELLSWLCEVINQANLVQMPGIVAAALSERAPPTSASLRDYARLLHARTLDIFSTSQANNDLLNGLIPRAREQTSDKLSLQEQAKTFVKKITKSLNDYTPAHARECAQKLKKICDENKSLVSSSMLFVGYWIAGLTGSGKGKRRKNLDPYARNSLTTYWSSLAPVFHELLYDVDLINLDSEESTDLCMQMLEYKHQSSRHADYFAKRLQDFFRWAAPFGVAAPEWSELNFESGYRTVSPGLISETEYQACHKWIQSDTELTQDNQLMLSFVLILAYRFGLRAKEAIGLLRRDWCQHEQSSWVLVQSNQYRTLKSQASRRAIPLLFKLSEKEQDIVERTLARYSSIAGKHINRPILCEASGNENGQPVLTTLAPRISEALIRVLRSATGNPEMVLHHCRHSFYNRVAPALFGLHSPLAEKFSNTADYAELRRTVLGPINSISRRSAMALARLMGHRFPSTGLKNYCHLVTDWIDELTPATHLRAHKINNIIQIPELPVVPSTVPLGISDALKYPEPSLLQLLKTLRLVSIGLGYERAGELMQIHPKHLSSLQRTIQLANDRMRFSSPANKKLKLKGSDLPNALLESISDAAWQRLIHHAEDQKNAVTYLLKDDEAQYIQELPHLISPNRHFLVEQPTHCKLLKHVINLFNIPADQYQIIAKGSSQTAQKRLTEAGFQVVLERDSKAKLDGFTVFISERGGWSRLDDFGGLILARSKAGIIRNSLELAVAFLATGLLIQIENTSHD